MGLTFVEGTVTGKKGKKVTVKFLVDSGAIYSLLPEKDWKAIGLKPKRTMTFTLADGTEVKRDVSECHMQLAQRDGHSPVILGEPGDEALLGAVTLEIMGLVLDPFKRTLQAMNGMLALLCPTARNSDHRRGDWFIDRSSRCIAESGRQTMKASEQVRLELLAALSQLSELRPQWRLGQTLANLAMTAGRLDAGGVWDLKDEEALVAATTLIERYSEVEPEVAAPATAPAKALSQSS